MSSNGGPRPGLWHYERHILVCCCLMLSLSIFGNQIDDTSDSFDTFIYINKKQVFISPRLRESRTKTFRAVISGSKQLWKLFGLSFFLPWLWKQAKHSWRQLTKMEDILEGLEETGKKLYEQRKFKEVEDMLSTFLREAQDQASLITLNSCKFNPIVADRKESPNTPLPKPSTTEAMPNTCRYVSWPCSQVCHHHQERPF